MASLFNDAAERAVKLSSDYNNILTHDPERKAALLQLVEQGAKSNPYQRNPKLLDCSECNLYSFARYMFPTVRTVNVPINK